MKWLYALILGTFSGVETLISAKAQNPLMESRHWWCCRRRVATDWRSLGGGEPRMEVGRIGLS